MQVDRISFQYPDGTSAAYDFHRRVTVIDVHPAHRRALAEHLLSSLWTTSPGVHVEFTTVSGASLVAFRPYGSPHRVIDIDRGADVTDSFRRGGGVDVLAHLETTPDRIADVLLADRADLALIDPTEEWMARLARHDPARVLAAAEAVVAAERTLAEATSLLRGDAPDPGQISAAYRQRDRTDRIEKRHEGLRLATLASGVAGPIVAVAGLGRIGTTASFGIILASLAVALVCLWRERMLAGLVDTEYSLLHAAGADSYDRLGAGDDRIPDDPAHRRRLLDAAERLRVASAAWQGLGGHVPPTWVLAHPDRLHETTALVPPDRPTADEAEALQAGLMSRVRAVRELGGGERLPLVLDDPLAGLGRTDRDAVLGFVERLAGEQQLVICTDDLDVVGWARLEEVAGNATVVDVNPGRRQVATGSPTPS
jgi:hypothetical protein